MKLTVTYGTKVLKYWKIIIVHFENINSGINLNISAEANTFLENNKIINIIFNYIFIILLFSKNVSASANIIYNYRSFVALFIKQLKPSLNVKEQSIQ